MDLAKIGIDLEIISLEKNTFIHDVQTGNFQLAILQLPEVVEPDLYHWMLYSLNVPNHLPQPGDSPYGPFDRRYFNPDLLSQIHTGDDGAAWVRSRLLDALNRMFFAMWGLPVENAGSNRTYYFNPEVDRLLDEGRYTMDTGKRKAIYFKIQEILAGDLPVISLWHEDNIAVMGADVENYQMLPLSKLTSLDRVRKHKE